MIETTVELTIGEVDGVRILNTTPHAISFQNAAGEVVIIPPSGKVLSASAVETEVGTGPCGVKLVRTAFSTTPESAEWVIEFVNSNPDVIVAGSIIAAQAYAASVYGMTPMPGFERVAPDQKRMNPHKWTTFFL